MESQRSLAFVVSRVFYVLLLLASSALGQTFYLDDSVPTNGNGAQGSPFNSVNNAWPKIEQAVKANYNGIVTVIVATGTGNYNSPIALAVTTIPATATGQLIVRGPTVPLGGTPVTFTCTGPVGAGPWIEFIGPTVGSQYAVTLENIAINECSEPLYLEYLGNVVLDTVYVWNAGLGSYHTSPIYFLGNQAVSISNSQFVNNQGTEYGNGAIEFSATSATTHNNIIQDTLFKNNTVPAGQSVIYIADDMQIIDSEITGCNQIALFVGNNIAGKTQAVSIASTYIHNNNVNYVIYLDSVGTNTLNIANGTTILENTDRNALVYAASSFDTVTVDVGAYISQNSLDGLKCAGSGVIEDSLGHPLCGISCTGSLKFDRCFVCGGASICVGCDDIPYSGPSCSIYRSPSSYPAPSIATWTGGSPSPLLLPVFGSTYFLNIRVETIREVTPAGTPAAVQNMSILPWYITQDVDFDPYTNITQYNRDFLWYSTDGKGTKVVISELVALSGNLTVDNNGLVFDIYENFIKFSFEIDNWPLLSSANHLEVDLTVELSEPLQNLTSSYSTLSGFNVTTLNIVTTHTKSQVNLQHFAILNGITEAIQVNILRGNTSSQTYQFVMPAGGFSSWFYDPDFGITLSATSPVGDGGDGGSANVGLITGLTVGLAVTALIVVLVVIAAGGAYTWYKRRTILGRLNNQPSST